MTNAEPFEPDEFPVLLVGNKCDLSDRRAVTLEEVVDWCAKKRPRKPITYIGEERERERENVCVCVCVRERQGESVCACVHVSVCACERDGECEEGK